MTSRGQAGQNTTQAFEQRIADRHDEYFVLRLYIAGLTPRSTVAVERIRAICERYLAGRLRTGRD